MNNFCAALRPFLSFSFHKLHKLFGVIVEVGYLYHPLRSAIFSPCPAMGALLLSGLPRLRSGLFPNSAASRFIESVCRCVHSLSHHLLLVDRSAWMRFPSQPLLAAFSWPFGQELLTKREYRCGDGATRHSIGYAYD